MINAPKKAEAAALGCPVEDKIDRVHAKRELIRKLNVFFWRNNSTKIRR